VTEIIRPSSAEDVAAALKRAADARQSIVIRGAGTKAAWGRPAGRVDAVLDMTGLNRVLAHVHGDMTATIEAGAALRDVNQALAMHGQTLPLDPPFDDRATIGGLLATNDSGPLRHRYGTPRDLVIGIRIATTDGVLSKAGGQVVKNVAGYDLSKLVTGSFGSLAAIVSATFKLAPLPAASKTMVIGVRDGEALGAVVRTMMSSQLEPVAFELVSRRSTQSTLSSQSNMVSASSAGSALSVVIKFASLPAVVDAQIAQAAVVLKPWATQIDVVDGDAERALWRAHSTGIWDRPGAIVRASWLPANIPSVLAGLKPCATSEGSTVTRAAGQGAAASGLAAPEAASAEVAVPGAAVAQGLSPAFVGRAAIGSGHIRIDGDVDAQAAAISRLRSSPVLGNVVIVRGDDELKARADVWESHGDRQPLFDALKRALDPRGVLNAGRGPL
jgi:glycolate oxidase FAD binding subunit